MKFVSKYSNYRIVLKRGIPAEPLTGRNAVPGLYVKFSNGVTEVKDESIVELMLKHPRFGTDFLKIEESEVDPFANSRKDLEPEHDVKEMIYGHVGKSLNPKPAMNMNSDQKRMFNEMVMDAAKEMAKEMAPKLAVEILKNLSEKKEDKQGQDTVEASVSIPEDLLPDKKVESFPFISEKRKPGRPPKK